MSGNIKSYSLGGTGCSSELITIDHAKHLLQLFDFANKYRGSYQSSCPFYCSYSGYQDELIWTVTWLYKAKNDTQYLQFVSNNQGWSNSATEFSWDTKIVRAQTLLAKEYITGKKDLAKYSDLDSFVCSLMPDSGNVQIKTTPVKCSSASFSADQIRTFAASQVDYILGKNPLNLSYMVGYGSKYPKHVHHRGASIPSITVLPRKVGCNEAFSGWYSTESPNPNTHVGAIVGGPDSNDLFNDVRSDSGHLEPTTYINAAAVGALAALLDENKARMSISDH